VLWKREDIREIEYASLLHDFGKIGVREHVLIKAKKLYPHELETIRHRFDFVLRSLEVDLLSRKLHAIDRGASAAELEELDHEHAQKRSEIDEAGKRSSTPTSRACWLPATSRRSRSSAARRSRVWTEVPPRCSQPTR
jgi:hypothetical protein